MSKNASLVTAIAIFFYLIGLFIGMLRDSLAVVVGCSFMLHVLTNEKSENIQDGKELND